MTYQDLCDTIVAPLERLKLIHQQARKDVTAMRALITAAGGRSHAHELLAAVTTYARRGGTAAALGALALRTTPGAAPAAPLKGDPGPFGDGIPAGGAEIKQSALGDGHLYMWIDGDCEEHADDDVDAFLEQINRNLDNNETGEFYRTGPTEIIATIDDQDSGVKSVKIKAPINTR